MTPSSSRSDPPAERHARIGLFGGTFDPPHNAHVALARAALDELQLDDVRWLPAGQPWQKADARVITPAAHRVAMVKLAIASDPRFVLDVREVQRSGPSYTIDTVEEIEAERQGAELFLIVGADQYRGLPTWRRWQDLVAQVTLAVARRPGSADTTPDALRGVAQRTIAMPPMDVSATDIRARAARGDSVATLVPAAVARYIDQHRLYRS